MQRHRKHFHSPGSHSTPARACPRTHAAPAAAAVFTSTWLGSVTMGMGEYIIRRLPLVKHIYSAAKQVGCSSAPAASNAVSNAVSHAVRNAGAAVVTDQDSSTVQCWPWMQLEQVAV